MKPDEVQLSACLDDLPYLRKALGEHWIREQQTTDAILSTIPLARSLRFEELRDHMVTLDRVLGSLSAVPGIARRHKRLRSDGPAFKETLTELMFAALLQQRGYSFDLPEKGPDFTVEISDGHVLHIEATTPRLAAWADDLDNRLSLLSRRTCHSVRTEPLIDGVPILDTDITSELVLEIVQDSIAHLTDVSQRSTAGESQVIRDWPEVGLRIIWTPNAEPRFSGQNWPSHAPPRQAFNYIVKAARGKAGQFPEGVACALVLGTNQIPWIEWHHYIEGLRRGNAYYGPFDWAEIPDMVKYIIFFSASYVDGHSPTIDILINEENLLPDPLGLHDFMEDLYLAGQENSKPDTELDEVIAALIRKSGLTTTDATDEESGL